MQETSVLFLLGSSRWSGIAPLDLTCDPVLSSGALAGGKAERDSGSRG